MAGITTILAHEIRNPLASLELFAELIENDADRRPQWISNLRVGIRTLSGTVNNVLSFHGSGKIEACACFLIGFDWERSPIHSNLLQIRPPSHWNGLDDHRQYPGTWAMRARSSRLFSI